MTNKKSKLKKVAMGAVTATVMASTIATSIPFNVLTAKAAEETTLTVNKVGALQSISDNLFTNTQFNGLSGWVQDAYSYKSGDWYYSNSGNGGSKPNGDGSVDTYIKNNQSGTEDLWQVINTIPGHRYRFSGVASDLGGGCFVAQGRDGDWGTGSAAVIGGTSAWSTPKPFSYDITARSYKTTFTVRGYSTSGTAAGYVRFSNLSVVDLDVMTQTTINSINTKATTITGTGEQGGTVTIKNGNTTIGTGTVDTSGNYSITVSPQSYGNTITASVTKNSQTLSASTVVTQADLAPTTINGLTNKSTIVTGNGEPGGTVTVKNGATTIGTATVQSNGTYSTTIPTQHVGDTVTASVTKNNKTSNISTTVVTQADLKQTTINDLTTTSTTVSGTAEPNATIVIKNSAGTEVASGTVGDNGNYSLTIAPQKYNDTITAMASLNGKTSISSTNVQDNSTPSKPNVNPFTDDDTTLSGTGTPGDKIQFIIGDKTYMGIIDAEGHFAIVVPKLPGGTVVNVVEENPNNGNRSTPTEVTVRDTTLGEPTIAPVKAGDTKVIITGEPGATVVLTTPDGDQTSKTADATGKATFNVEPAQAGSSYSATQTGANGKASPAATVTVTAVVTNGTITTNNFTLGKDKYVVGTYTGDVKSFRLTIDGTMYTGGATDSARGTYTFYALDKITKTGSFKIEGLDASGRVLDTKTGNIVANQTPNTP
ncbi:Ig-like domain-containing protein, partial [Listeria fleischmannii]|uniref:Ig-like domain-containing protein n=1 Tax=Listeria fleischmannii TaxID=1069827 RepID=UPI0018403BA6